MLYRGYLREIPFLIYLTSSMLDNKIACLITMYHIESPWVLFEPPLVGSALNQLSQATIRLTMIGFLSLTYQLPGMYYE